MQIEFQSHVTNRGWFHGCLGRDPCVQGAMLSLVCVWLQWEVNLKRQVASGGLLDLTLIPLGLA